MSPNDNTTGKRLPIKDCCAVVEAYKMFVQTWIYRSKNDKGHVPDQVGSSNVTLEAKNKVEKIWAESVNQRYFLAKVYGNVITYEDIGSLNEHSWLTDKVMDAYISHLSQVENDKGTIKVRHELVSTTNNILNGQYVPGRNETNKFEPYDVIMGAYHQRGHWNLLIRILMLYYELKQKSKLK
ncbi:uncharacterized protein LOC143070914 isoform X1 [Mytilus galloprovincialis]|uniref:uncharacterized protein LOC143070914 isoform X1 n=1 Tax=Mytilus galloprovincialis TaxID=29158 RepID=UPI003F7C49EB